MINVIYGAKVSKKPVSAQENPAVFSRRGSFLTFRRRGAVGRLTDEM